MNDVNHDTRSITFGPDNTMYVSAGADCDACEGEDPKRAAILRFNDDGSGVRVLRFWPAQRGWPRHRSAHGAALGVGE